MNTIVRLGVVCVILSLAAAAFAETHALLSPYSVRDFGARGDGATKDTASVQKAIDACSKAGGGTVLFPAGIYLCGSLHLRSAVTLQLDTAATIKGSKDVNDYDPVETLPYKNDADEETSFFHHALIWGEGIDHIAIVGEGTIDVNWDKRHGPKAVALKRCTFVDIKGIRLLNAPNYNISLLGTDYVNIDGVTILNAYADGIDPDSCRHVRIANCHIESSDDAIVPKTSFSLGERRSCEDIVVTNCYLGTTAQSFKLGTESGGDFKRIAVSNCVMAGLAPNEPASGGICLESVDGSNIDGVVVSNITMVNVRAPVFIRLGNRGRDQATPTPGTLRNVVISGVVATNATYPSSITGIPGRAVEGITLSDIRILYRGGEKYTDVLQDIPEQIPAYPTSRMFGVMPAYGLYCRHARGLTLRNVQLAFTDDFCRITAESRKEMRWANDGLVTPSEPGNAGTALVCDDVSELVLTDLKARPGKEHPVVRLSNVCGAMIQASQAPESTEVFLEISGVQSSKIAVLGNDLRNAKCPVQKSPDVPRGAVASKGNLGF
ncbi:MAG: glycoside hydrolase family 28 protein [Candidatus Hydrogenedentes bacterium]|nr:glycoside hydrolase family 28 protein [Candidatus Hydrogenedentota bacterium]